MPKLRCPLRFAGRLCRTLPAPPRRVEAVSPTGESGVIYIFHLLLIVAVLGIIIFLLFSSTGPFKIGIFSSVFPILSSHAQVAGQVKYVRINKASGGGQYFIIKLTDPLDIQTAIDDLNGLHEQFPLIYSGVVQSGSDGYNAGGPNNGYWNWHLDPATIGISETVIIDCDDWPSNVEGFLLYPARSRLDQRFCSIDGRVGALYDQPPLPDPSVTQGQTFNFAMDGDSNLPAVQTGASGTGILMLAVDQTTATLNLNYSGLTSAALAAQIQGPATATQSANTLYQLNFIAGPAGSDLVTTLSGITAQQVSDLKNGLWYVSIPTTDFPSGEIRGQFPAPSPTPAPTPSCPLGSLGDINCDGKINIFDYNILLTNFGQTGCGIDGDIDNSCKVNIFDYNIIITNFGKTV